MAQNKIDQAAAVIVADREADIDRVVEPADAGADRIDGTIEQATPPPAAAAGDRPRARPGRPAAAEPSSSLSTWLPVRFYDQICRMARAERTTVSSMTRTLLQRQLKQR